jgi:tRNA dimethylallyltransferase
LRARAPAPDNLQVLKLVLTMPRAQLREHIAARTVALFNAGWPDEVAGLLAAGVAAGAPAMQSLGYADLAAALARGESPGQCLGGVVIKTRQYAKRQETFFRREADAVWMDVTEPGFRGRARDLVRAFLAAGRGPAGPQ